jgi:hypothetical protein
MMPTPPTGAFVRRPRRLQAGAASGLGQWLVGWGRLSAASTNSIVVEECVPGRSRCRTWPQWITGARLLVEGSTTPSRAHGSASDQR